MSAGSLVDRHPDRLVGARLARVKAVAAALLSLTAAMAAAQQPQASPTAMAVDKPLPPPPSRKAAAVALLADYRYDDLLWENDRTAHRIYGHALEKAEPPSGSGIDSWGKQYPWPFADRQLRTGDQHGYHGEGIDFYNVGTGRGAGGLGIWFDNKLWTSRNFVRHHILKSGGDVADFTVDYAPWPVGTDRRVWETRRFTLPLGTHFTRMVSTLSSNRSEPLVVGIGIGKKTTGAADGKVMVDRARGVMTWWGPADDGHGRMAIALRVDPAMIVDQRGDFDNHLFMVRVTPGRPFVYYSGSAWDRGAGGFTTQAQWEAYAKGERLDFTPPAR